MHHCIQCLKPCVYEQGEADHSTCIHCKLLSSRRAAPPHQLACTNRIEAFEEAWSIYMQSPQYRKHIVSAAEAMYYAGWDDGIKFALRIVNDHKKEPDEHKSCNH